MPDQDLLSSLAGLAQTRIEAVLIEMPGWFVDGGHRFFWLYFVSFVLLGALAWRRYYRDAGAPAEAKAAPRGLLRFLFPPQTYRHPSALLDLKLIIANRFFGPSALLSRLLLGPLSVAWVASLTQGGLVELTGAAPLWGAWTLPTLAGFTLATALVEDFATYAVHALHHRWPLLWEFHKVHHSAEVLTPFTVYRKHPVYNLLSRVTNIAIIGPFQGLLAFLLVVPADPLTLFGANAVFSIFHLLGSNLRHSHVWLSFGPLLNRLVVSPALHQIHHSKAPRHWNKNYGEVFALWDWLFGTLYLPGRQREELEFGVAGQEGQEHATLWQVYFVPFRNCARLLRERFGRELPAPAARP